MTMAFDTHAAAKAFERAGFTEAQVEALIDVTRQTTLLPDVSTLATKADLLDVKTGLAADIRTSVADLRAEIATAKVQAITVILSGMAVITALGTVLSKLMR